MLTAVCFRFQIDNCFIMSTSNVSHVVVGWAKKGEEDLENELVEAIQVKKLIVKGVAEVGIEVSLQFKNELWTGEILSLHSE